MAHSEPLHASTQGRPGSLSIESFPGRVPGTVMRSSCVLPGENPLSGEAGSPRLAEMTSGGRRAPSSNGLFVHLQRQSSGRRKHSFIHAFIQETSGGDLKRSVRNI